MENGVELCAGVKRAGVENSQAFGGEIAYPDIEGGKSLAAGAEGRDLHAPADADAGPASFFIKVTAAIGFQSADDLLISIGGERE